MKDILGWMRRSIRGHGGSYCTRELWGILGRRGEAMGQDGSEDVLEY